MRYLGSKSAKINKKRLYAFPVKALVPLKIAAAYTDMKK
jgi:hypothetical protein